MKSIPYILILVLILWVIYLAEFRKPKVVEKEKIVYVDSIVYETLLDTVLIYQPKLIDRKVVVTDSFIDTVYIVRDYNTEYYYSDTILEDHRGRIVVNDIIYRNRIKSRQSQIKLNKEIVYRTQIKIPDPKTKFLIGGGVSGWVDKFGIEAGAGLKFKSGNVGLISYDPINKSVRVSYFKSL